MTNAWREDDVEAGGTNSRTSERSLIRKDQTVSSQLRVVAKFDGRFPSFDTRIPRNVVSLDKHYLRQCLDWVCGKASKVMPSDAPLALTASVIDGNSELWRRLAVKRASRPKSVNSNSLPCHGIAATDRKSIPTDHHHYLQSPTLHSTGMRSVNSVLPGGVSSSFSSGRTSNSAAAGSVSQGMLVFRWVNGMPCFVFSPDETQQVYVADLTSDRIHRDHNYLIHIHEHGMKERSIDESCHYLVGEMNVVEWISVCSDASEIRTTEFVLFGGSKILVEEEMRDPARKNKTSPAVKTFSFKRWHASKRRNIPCPSGISEDFYTELSQDKVAVLQSYRHPSNELAAAIVVKHHAKGTVATQKPEAGGWGMKFLRKIVAANINIHSDECSESMDVIIPASLHGLPRSASGGPSTLIDRWKSSGKCDCGGWDLGCPLTLHKARSTEPAGILRTVDLVVRGSNTTLRMTNVRDGLFLIRFDRSLSAIQTLSVAVAYIHTHSPLMQKLRPS